MVNLETAPLDDEPHWYSLRSHNKQVPLPLASPIPVLALVNMDNVMPAENLCEMNNVLCELEFSNLHPYK